MSSIAFTSPSNTIYISGRERASMSVLCANMLKAQIGSMKIEDKEFLRSIFAPGHYMQVIIDDMERGKFGSGLEFGDRLDTFLSLGDHELYADGKAYDLFSLQLNSALLWGNRAVQMAAKLHGQCEIHAYCEGRNRAWLADILSEGVECHIFRGDAYGYDGWAKLIDFLRSNDQEPVVTSYSVCESFPGPHCAPADMKLGDDPWDAWDQLSEEEAWRLGMAHVRSEPSLEISPERLGRVFGHGLSGKEFIGLARTSLAARKEEQEA